MGSKKSTKKGEAFSRPTEEIITIADFDKASQIPAEPELSVNGDEAAQTSISEARILTGGSTILTDEGTLRIRPFKPSGSRGLKALISFTPRTSHFDLHNASSQSDPFRGFYSLFWIGLFLFALQTIIRYYQETGYVFSGAFATLITGDALELAISDGVMVGSSYLCVPFVMALERGYFRYYWTGLAIQHVGQLLYLAITVIWVFNKSWYWVQGGFLVLHCLSMLMKIHSYIAFNGQLSDVRLSLLRTESSLSNLLASRPGGPSLALAEAKKVELEHEQEQAQLKAEALALATPDHATPTTEKTTPPLSSSDLRQRLVSAHAKLSSSSSLTSNPTSSTSSPPSEPAVAEPRRPSTLTFHPSHQIGDLASNIDAMRIELTSTGAKQVVWPKNVSFWNFSDYLLIPTLCYELEYPRTNKLRPVYILEKILATMGTFSLIIGVTEHYIIPRLPEEGDSFIVAFINLALPMMINYILIFYFIFECVCNGFAELTYFADREFYGAWWNATSWDIFAREWNKPVHTFLLRHVYSSTLETGKVSRTSASFLTFLLSALCHELVMCVVSKKIRPYLFLLQMAQLPLIALGRLPFVKQNQALGNVVFWLGLMSGFPLLAIAYLMY